MKSDQILAGVMVLALAAGAGMWFGRAGGEPPGPVAVTPLTPVGAPADVITVHVSGAVVSPGLVEVTTGARIADVIFAAGGARGDAALGVLNLAATVQDGDQIVVATHTSAVPGVTADEGRVPINRAEPSELEALPGVGPVLAARIAAHRETHGPFTTVEDLLAVPGIGEAKLAQLRDHVVLP